MGTKTLQEWEELHNCQIKNEDDGSKKLTEDEFQDIPRSQRHGVIHKDRIEFLQDNGFEVNRENMIDHRLSAGHLIHIDGEFIDYDEYTSKLA
jgi:hypothetical protein